MKKNKNLKQTTQENILNRVEFHREAVALLPDLTDKKPGVAFMQRDPKFKSVKRFCTCTVSGSKTCTHLMELTQVFKTIQKKYSKRPIEEDFKTSIWYRLASILAEGSRETSQSVQLKLYSYGDKKILKVFGSNGDEILSYLSQGPDRSHFIERCGNLPDDAQVSHRGLILEKLALMTLTETERILDDRGMKSRRQALESSFWYRLSYHCCREFGPRGCTFHPAVDENSGSFMVTCKDSEDAPIFHTVIPRTKVQALLAGFKELLPNQNNMAIHPIPLKSIFKVSQNTELDLDVRPVIQLLQEEGESKFFEREDLERFRYGNLIYIKELGILAELERPGKEREFRAPVRMIIKKYQVPNFLEEVGEDLYNGQFLVDADVKGLRILKTFDRVEISPDAIDRDWCWLSVKYGFGNTAISLYDILSAKKEGQRFISIPEGWVDCQSSELENFDALFDLAKSERFIRKSGGMKLSRTELFRLSAVSSKPLEIKGDKEHTDILKRLFEMKPSTPLPEIKGMRSTLRKYQKLGTQWLWYLFENGFGGLLCDDMGLGKTHQVMAFMLCLREYKKNSGPFLVVCPTTVLSHWSGKILDHVPGLKAAVYHGGERDLEATIKNHNVLLTSYGILRRDIYKLKKLSFPLVVFDEVQYIKNPETKAFSAASELRTAMKLGLTGTPIENSIGELKALLDLTVPGYMGSDKDFKDRYVNTVEKNNGSLRKEELRKLISPFTLRRLKKTVLDELPEKIEDIRTCELSEDQVKLYKDAVASRGKGLLEVLKNGKEPVPYIHIFALLTLLKQICNHPALVDNTLKDYAKYRSGKWELFKELLAECLDSGQKVVVYSQFVGMINIMEKYLKEQKAEFVTLTGASRNRGELISRFNTDPDCRIFVGSLKAGGAGIDLVAGSVVIHYDRWWNAAKEDQATDRVHRIGQKRGVQVFKLVTEGTLEEKISAIIEKKRNLMDSIVKEDDPRLLKTFSKQELIEMLASPLSDF